MILETLRIIVDQYRHGTEGVNAQLETLLRDPEDPQPRKIDGVTEPTSNDYAAQDMVGPDWPTLLVMPENADLATATVPANVRDGSPLVISSRYVTRERDWAKAVRDAMYTLRAQQRSITALMRIDPNDARRTRNDICLINVQSMAMPMLRESFEEDGKDGAHVVGVILHRCFVRDLRV